MDKGLALTTREAIKYPGVSKLAYQEYIPWKNRSFQNGKRLAEIVKRQNEEQKKVE
jgi:hypothetical protein